MTDKQLDWEKAQKARLAQNAIVWEMLSEDQREAIIAARKGLQNFLAEYSEQFDVSGSTARALDAGFWKLETAFRLPPETKGAKNGK